MTGSYRELRVPTNALEVEILTADGRAFHGRIFVPDVAATHRGPMRAAEWMNDTEGFFPFRPADGSGSFLLNRLGISLGIRNEIVRDIITATIGAIIIVLLARLIA